MAVTNPVTLVKEFFGSVRPITSAELKALGSSMVKELAEQIAESKAP